MVDQDFMFMGIQTLISKCCQSLSTEAKSHRTESNAIMRGLYIMTYASVADLMAKGQERFVWVNRNAIPTGGVHPVVKSTILSYDPSTSFLVFVMVCFSKRRLRQDKNDGIWKIFTVPYANQDLVDTVRLSLQADAKQPVLNPCCEVCTSQLQIRLCGGCHVIRYCSKVQRFLCVFFMDYSLSVLSISVTGLST